MIHEIKEATEYLKKHGVTAPEVGVILGTGLGNKFVEKIKNPIIINYNFIPFFPVSTVEFHKGQLVLGVVRDKKIIVMQGRFHYYEGYSMQQITFPIRVMKALGTKKLLLSNAAGGMNPAFKKGDLVLIEDHINMQPENPLRGLNDPIYGNRFVDMSSPYDETLSKQVKKGARSLKMKLKKGVYVSVAGPNLETRAEYRYLRAAGADMVGMSTVPEVIVANHIGLPCAAISIITDECNPENLKPVSIQEIIKVAGEADKNLSRLFKFIIGQ